jgi:predicted Rossmann-fold nucleotide-binding protein
LDELAEILTWKQLGLVDKRVLILNSNGFFDHLISQMQQMTESGFLSKSNFDSLGIAQSVDELMALLIS